MEAHMTPHEPFNSERLPAMKLPSKRARLRPLDEDTEAREF